MDIEEVREYCLKKKEVSESFPFDEDSLVFKVVDKIFLIANLNPPFSINIKCDPEKAVELREHYKAVTPGYHMNKLHWNTVALENNLPNELIKEWIDNSYNLAVKSLSKFIQKRIK
jgi:predicted DNA-binding protein (MmcQ/YjbR family)